MLSGTIDPQVLLEKCTSNERDPLSLTGGSDLQMWVWGDQPPPKAKKNVPFPQFPQLPVIQATM